MALKKRLFKVVTVLISTLLLAVVVSRMHLSDHVRLASGEVLKGKILESSELGLRMESGDGLIRDIPVKQIATDDDGQPRIERGVWVVAVRTAGPSGRWWLLLAVTLFALPPLSGAFRWWVLLRIQGINLSMRRSVALTYIGYLFNYIMLGLTGGDVVKAYYVSRQTDRKTEAVLSVFMDRATGLIALTALGLAVVLSKVTDPGFTTVVLPIEVFAVLAVFGALVMLSRRLRRRMPQTLVVVAVVGGIAVLAGRVLLMGFSAVRHEVLIFAIAALVFVVLVLSPARRLLQWETIRAKLGRKRIVREVDASFSVYRGHPFVLTGIFVLSVLMHAINVVATYACGRALGIPLGLGSYLLLVPLIVMISSIPISVAGLGVQETMFPFFFGLPGVGVGGNEATMLAFMFRFCSSFLWVIPGYVLLLLWRDHPRVSAVADAALSAEEEEVSSV